MLKDIPSNELINLTVKQLSEKYFYQDGSIRNEIRKRGLVNIHNTPPKINISLEDYKNHSIHELCQREKVTRHIIISYALKTYNLTMEDIKRFGEERIEKRYDLTHISDEELSKPFSYITKVYGVPQTSIKPEREKRGIIILAQAPYTAIIRKVSNEELFDGSIKEIAKKYKVGTDTVFRERKRRMKEDDTLKIIKKRKLEDVSSEELFRLSISQICKKYNVGATTVTMERKRRK